MDLLNKKVENNDITFELHMLNSSSYKDYDVIEKYKVDKASVTIAEKDGRGLYLDH